MKKQNLYALIMYLVLLRPIVLPTVVNAQVGIRTDIKKEIARLFEKRNIQALPSLSSQVRVSIPASKNRQGLKSNQSISSTLAPTLKTIASSSIKDIFWRDVEGSNVVDAINNFNPSQNQCSEFYSGQEDGQSAGMGACHLAETVGFSYSRIIESGISLCYMRNFPTNKNLNAGAISIDAGQLPEGGIQRLFSPPIDSSARVVKVNFNDEQDQGQEDNPGQSNNFIFLQVPSRLENTTAGNLYSVNIWSCDGENAVTGYDLVSISKSLRYYNEHADSNIFGENFSTSIGFLTLKGSNLVWDPTRARTSSTLYVDGENDGRFKSEIEIASNRTIKVKRLDSFDGSISKGYLVTKYSGSNAQNLRFLSGAFKDVYMDQVFTQATKYRDSYYAIDEGSSLLDEVESVDLDSGFYSSSLEVDFDTSQFSCDVAADVEITLDFSNITLVESIRECEEELLNNMYFCHNDSDVYRADQSYAEACSGP